MTQRPLLHRLSQSECPTVTYVDDAFPIVLHKGKGMHLWDTDGKRYVDFTACFGVAALGHRPKIAQDALRKQASKLIHGMGDVHPTESKIRFLDTLKEMLPYAHPNILLSSTGAEAVETALKTAVLATGRQQFISFCGAYHGLLTGPLRLSDRPHFTAGFEGWLQQQATILPFPDDEATVLGLLEDALKQKIYAAIVLEPIQGRGGDRAFPVNFVQAAAQLAKQYGSLVIFDEIFTGFGRTGTLFAYEYFGVVPDIICLGKAMGGGMPLSACAGDVLAVWGKSPGEARHTSTFLGHPLACAVGLASIEEIRKRLPEFQAELVQIDAVLKDFLRDNVTISGKGFMRGLHFHSKTPGYVFELTKQLLQQNVLALPSGANGDVLSLTPPLIARAKDFKALLEKIQSACLT